MSRSRPRVLPGRAGRSRRSVLVVLVVVLAGCTAQDDPVPAPGGEPDAAPAVAAAPAGEPPLAGRAAASPTGPLPGMPAVTDPHNVYAAAGAGMLSDAARAATPLVYVPHTRSGDVWVLDPATFAVVGRYELGRELQHVVPSYDLTTLYASDDQGNTLTPFDPRTGRPGPSFPVTDPYQPVLHAGRTLGDLGGRAAPRGRVPTREHPDGPAGHQARPGRLGVLHRRPRPGRRLGARRRGHDGAARDPHRARHARALPVPGRRASST